MARTIPRPPDFGDWLREVKGRGVARVAVAFDLAIRGRSLTPCPACGAEARGRGDRRGPVGITTDGLGWRCHRCEAGGDALALAALRATGAADARGRWADVRRECAAAGLCPPDPRDDAPPVRVRRLPPPPPAPVPTVQRPPAAEVAALWAASLPVDRTLVEPDPSDLDASGFLARRRWWPGDVARLDLARLLPLPGTHDFPRWWPARWARTWRLVAPAYEPDGRIGSLHARAIVPGATPKTRWPKGCAAGELLLADGRGAALLRGEELAGLAGVLVAEGLTGTIAAGLWAAARGHRFAVLGVTSGSAPALRAVRWPAGVPCYVATDNDGTGEGYAREIRAALPRTVRMLRARPEERG